MEQFKPLITDTILFSAEPDVNKPSRFRPNPPKAKATWLKPELVCEVSFAEVTSDGVFRHPSFEGMRDDKKASDVVRETAADIEALKASADSPVDTKSKLVAAPKRSGKQTLLNPTEETQVKKVNGTTLNLAT